MSRLKSMFVMFEIQEIEPTILVKFRKMEDCIATIPRR